MKIGELAERAGATTRQLRYYEAQGLIAPDRTHSNYRDYGDDAVEKVRQIRLLIESGMPTRVIRVLLPCVDGPGAEMPAHENPEMATMLESERERLREQIEKLTRSQHQVECYLDRVREAASPAP
ncbi:MerR family transcriptional regulator [Kribbia dieselivorans]|uniref:MerR family transcriptional regulator n=1 Tax=Kribbia dieselivorans TaxID=331526 RepID=UPI0008395812|nr:MerR family transcriptional regulator [Kribbia dieselivorans]